MLSLRSSLKVKHVKYWFISTYIKTIYGITPKDLNICVMLADISTFNTFYIEVGLQGRNPCMGIEQNNVSINFRDTSIGKWQVTKKNG